MLDVFKLDIYKYFNQKKISSILFGNNLIFILLYIGYWILDIGFSPKQNKICRILMPLGHIFNIVIHINIKLIKSISGF